MNAKNELVTGLALICLSLAVAGWTPTDLVYFTNIERQRDGSRVPFPPEQEIVGRIRSNDTLLFSSGARYFSTFFSAQDTYLVAGDGQPELHGDVHLGMDSLHLGNVSRYIRNNANPYITDQNGRFMTWIKLRGDAGIDIFQYPLGSVRNESGYQYLPVPNWQSIFVDGQCEIEGTLTGSLTIGSSGDMWLIDDVRYTRANDHTGDFNENDRTIGMLALVSERNIIIDDNNRNGKANGVEVDRNNWNRHSIVITAAVVAPNGSFTFEHQNNDWEMYQGPTPDERGWVFMKGCLIQNRRGLLHTSNHEGTGYELALSYDSRFERRPPVSFQDDREVRLWGHFDRLELDSMHVYYVGEAEINDLTILPEHHLIFHSSSRLIVRRTLNILGREEAPVQLHMIPNQDDDGELIFTGRGRNSIKIEHAIIEEGLNVDLTSDSISIANSVFGGRFELSGNFDLTHSTLESGISLGRPGHGSIKRCLLFDGLEVANYGWDLNVDNNTIVRARSEGIRLESGARVRIVNNIITGSRDGIVCDGNEPPEVGYNLLFDIQRRPYYGCEAGEGALSVDPLFISPRREDYHLQETSPCIDAGDPDSPRDPDGTRADIGAFWYEQGLAVGDPPFNSPPASRGGKDAALSAAPNPFNSSTVIRFQSAQSAVRLSIYDLSGRKVFSTVSPPRLTASGGAADYRKSAEGISFTWDASSYPAGIYFARLDDNGKAVILKLMLVR